MELGSLKMSEKQMFEGSGSAGHSKHMRVMPSAPSVVQQARMMDAARPGTAWHAVKNGNLELITKLFPTQCNVYEKGPLGENVFHLAMLLNTPSTLAIARYLVKLYRAPLVNCPFQERKVITDLPGAYEGQTALHIAIVNRDYDMVKFLVQEGANIRTRAWGTFFHPEGPMYYGEFPLSFAACTGQKDVVAFLKRHGAKVNEDKDAAGNTALHMTVVHAQPDMYDYLIEYCGASEAEPNHTGLTPLVLAAQLGKTDMFEHIYERRRKAFYTFGKLTSYSLSLREIDTIQEDGEGEYVPNALEVVLRKGHLDMLREPLLQTILKYKWETFARAQFVIHSLFYIALMVSQTTLIWLHNTPGAWNGAGRASQELLGFGLALAMFVFEMIDFVGWSRECYMRRLIMTLPDAQVPLLYQLPGEEPGTSQGRQNIFVRWSARMGMGLHRAVSDPARPPKSPRSRSNLGPGGGGGEGGSPPKVGDSAALSAPLPSRAINRPLSMVGGATPFGSGATAGTQPTPAAAATTPFSAAGGGAGPGLGGGLSGSPAGSNSSSPFTATAPAWVTGATPGATGAAGMPRTSPLGYSTSFPAASGGGGSITSVSATTLMSPYAGGGGPGSGGSVVSPYAPMAGDAGSPNRGPGPLGEGVQVQQQEDTTHPAAPAAPPAAAAAADGDSAPADVPETHAGDSRHNPISSSSRSSSSRGRLGGILRRLRPSAGSEPAAAVPAAAGPVGEGREGSPRPSNLQPPGSSGPSLSGLRVEWGPVTNQGSFQGSPGPGTPGAASDEEDTDLVSVGLPRARSYMDVERAMAAAAASAGGGGAGGSQQTGGSGSSRLGPNPSLTGTTPGAAAAAAAAVLAGPGSTSGGHHPPIIRMDSRGQLLGSVGSHPASGRSSWDSMATEMVPVGGVGRVSLTAPPGMPSCASTPIGGLGAVGPPMASDSYKRSKSFASGVGEGGRSGGQDGQEGTRPALLNEQLLSFLERQRTRPRSGGGDLPAQNVQRRARGDLSALDASVRRGTDGLNLDPSGRGGGEGGGGGAGGEGLGGGETELRDLESQHSLKEEPHKSPLRAILETTFEGSYRMLEDPWLFVWHLHLLATFTHFILWISTYGWIGGSGPANPDVRALDDIIVSMMGLSGWLAVVYFFRGLEATGKLTVILERCLLDVAKFISLYVLWNIGFTMAFYTMQHGTQLMTGTPPDHHTLLNIQMSNDGSKSIGSTALSFDSIGEGMVFLVQMSLGLSLQEYMQTCNVNYSASAVVCTIYYLLYIATSVILLLNLLTAMIIRTYNTAQEDGVRHWRRRWAIYVVKAERRMPPGWLQHHRLGQRTWDPRLQRTVYSHVFEVIDDDKEFGSAARPAGGGSSGGSGGEERGVSEAQLKALEGLLDTLRKKPA